MVPKSESARNLQSVISLQLKRYPRIYVLAKKVYISVNNVYICVNNAINTKRKIRGRNNLIRTWGALLNKVDFDVQGSNNIIVIKSGCVINGTRFMLRGSGHRVIIGSNCCFVRGGSIWFEDSDCQLLINDNTTMEEAHIALTEPGSRVEVGKDCMIAYDVDIRCGDSHSIIDLSTGQRINYAKDVKIGDHVWLAAHVQVLKGVTIGSNSIIAIRSVVTKDVSPDSIAAGIPAEVIKTNVTWDRQRIYTTLKQS